MDRVKVRMTRTEKGAEEGIKVVEYVKGETYNMGAWLADVFVNQLKCAKYAGKIDKKDSEKPAEKTVDAPKEAPEGDSGAEKTVDTPKETPGDNKKVETGDAGQAKAVEGDVMTAAGKPYQTMNTALSARKKKQLTGSAVVAVEGGYVIRPQ